MSENILDCQEAKCAAAKGPRFNGWFESFFYIDGVNAQRIANWIKREAMERQRKGGGQ